MQHQQAREEAEAEARTLRGGLAAVAAGAAETQARMQGQLDELRATVATESDLRGAHTPSPMLSALASPHATYGPRNQGIQKRYKKWPSPRFCIP